VRVESRKLAMVLHAYTYLRFNSIIMCMIRDHSLILHVLLEPTSNGTLTFYLPVVPLANMTDDDDEGRGEPMMENDHD
jgi:hypothetical protein